MMIHARQVSSKAPDWGLAISAFFVGCIFLLITAYGAYMYQLGNGGFGNMSGEVWTVMLSLILPPAVGGIYLWVYAGVILLEND